MKELLLSITKKDFDIHYFSGTGAGGQHRNKHQNCVRMLHRESGASATAKDSRSKEKNVKSAFDRIIKSKTFKKWHRITVAKAMMSDEEKRKEKEKIKKTVDESMNEKNLKIEIKDNNKWIEEKNG